MILNPTAGTMSTRNRSDTSGDFLTQPVMAAITYSNISNTPDLLTKSRRLKHWQLITIGHSSTWSIPFDNLNVITGAMPGPDPHHGPGIAGRARMALAGSQQMKPSRLIALRLLGLAYLGYLGLVFAFLCDIAFKRARVTTGMVNLILNAIGSAASVVPC